MIGTLRQACCYVFLCLIWLNRIDNFKGHTVHEEGVVFILINASWVFCGIECPSLPDLRELFF